MRPATACLQCRNNKRKCHPGRLGKRGPCSRCQSLRLRCSFTAHNAHAISQTTHDITNELDDHDEECALNDAIVTHLQRTDSIVSDIACGDPVVHDPSWRIRMVSLYFESVHDTHHSLFHRPTFEREVRDGTVDDAVLYAVLALGLRLSTVSGSLLRSIDQDFITDKAHRSLDIRDTSLSTIRACILLGTLCYVDGKSEAEAVYYATAARLAIILNLPRRQCSTELEHQINLRVWWTLYMIDIWSSAGLQIPRQIPFDETIQLPISEYTFIALKGDIPVQNQGVQSTGIWGEMAKLSRIWAEVQDLNRTSVEKHLSPMLLAPQIASLADKLRSWRESLPSEVQETSENLERAGREGFGTSLAALHLGFHYYHEVLFYQYMAESQQRSSPLADYYAAECASHARAFCDLLYLCETIPGCRCMYAMVGHMLVITSTVYMHMLLFHNGDNVRGQHTEDEHSSQQTIRARLGRNFEILTELQRCWAVTLKTSLARLKVFHNACRWSMENSFSMDRWMLMFILQHGTSMPEKFPGIGGGSNWTGIIQEDEENGQGGQEGDIIGSSLQDWYAETLS